MQRVDSGLRHEPIARGPASADRYHAIRVLLIGLAFVALLHRARGELEQRHEDCFGAMNRELISVRIPHGRHVASGYFHWADNNRGYTREDVLWVFKGFFMQIICS